LKKIVILLLSVLVLQVSAQEKKNVPAKTSWGLSERLRFVSWDNAVTLDGSRKTGNTFTRHRTSAWFNWRPLSALNFRIKVTNEFRYYFTPERDFTIHELIADNFYLQWQNRKVCNFDLTIGRQNIMLGEGFVMMDGHPLDGSRSIYFNAARLDLLLKQNHKLTLFALTQPENDDLLPVINEEKQRLVEQPEKGAGIYYTGKYRSFGLEGYFIHKTVEATNISPISQKLNTIGMRFQAPITARLSVTGEGALQSGKWDTCDQKSWGGYLHADYKIPGHSILKGLTLGAIALSGDDPATPEYEEWNPVFSRWPKWSESYIYTLIPEKGGKVAYWSNFKSIYATVKFKFCLHANLALTYHHLGAFYDIGYLSSRPMGTGTHRGNLFIAKFNYNINKYLSGHLLYETLRPGSFYNDRADSYSWFRFEMLYRL